MVDYIDMTSGDLWGEIAYHSNKMTEKPQAGDSYLDWV